MKPFTNDIWNSKFNDLELESDKAAYCIFVLASRVAKIAHGYRMMAHVASCKKDDMPLALASTRAEQMLENAAQLMLETSRLVEGNHAFKTKDDE
jgi:predicted RNA-binding protein (virulence factor B family)